jgi:Arc/MetJ-type ribon-helix-helix transcriptional regulator
MNAKRQTTRWNIPVPQTLDDALEKAIFLDSHMTKSDFVREAVREKLASMGYKNEPFKEIPNDATTQRSV